MEVPQPVTVEVRPGRPTLTDVARLAGVSRQTASRVARGGGLVHEETARRVRQVIDDLGYRPNVVARALSVGITQQIGVVTHSTFDYGPAAILNGIETAAGALGYRVIVSHVHAVGAGELQEAVDGLVRTGCDGIIVMAPWASATQTLAGLSSSVPLITTSQVPGYDGPAVHPDTAAAAEEATTYLLDLGHETVHHVSGPPGWNPSALRIQGWRRALIRAGRPRPPVLAGDWSSTSGAVAGAELARDESVTAIFAANDMMALGVLHSLAQAGRRVPEDVSVMGFDGSPGSEHFQPPLTTMQGQPEEHGRAAVHLILARLGRRPPGWAATMRVPIVLRTDLVIRQSTAPRIR